VPLLYESSNEKDIIGGEFVVTVSERSSMWIGRRSIVFIIAKSGVLYTPPHVSMESIRTPWGVRGESVGSLCGVRVDSVWSLWGVRVDSVWIPCGVCVLYSVDSMWTTSPFI
jgi:hypothetical protein